MTTATLRCGEENSSAKIVINNPPFCFANDFDFYRREQSSFRIRNSSFAIFSAHSMTVTPSDCKNSSSPARCNLLRRFEPIQIQMKQSQASAAVFIHQCKRRRMHTRRDAKSACKAFDQLRFARPQIAGQRDHASTLCRAPPRFAERFSLGRIV